MDIEQAEHVHFVELAGEGARERLRAQAERWRAAGVRTTLLRGADDDALWLLVGLGCAAPPAASVDGSRTWRFVAHPEAHG